MNPGLVRGRYLCTEQEHDVVASLVWSKHWNKVCSSDWRVVEVTLVNPGLVGACEGCIRT